MNQDVQNFINRFITTSEEIPISIRVEDICPNICGHDFVLPPLEIQSNVSGIGAGLVRHVSAYVGWATLIKKKLSFVFDFGAHSYFAVF
jgi:hypothetical protein